MKFCDSIGDKKKQIVKYLALMLASGRFVNCTGSERSLSYRGGSEWGSVSKRFFELQMWLTERHSDTDLRS